MLIYVVFLQQFADPVLCPLYVWKSYHFQVFFFDVCYSIGCSVHLYLSETIFLECLSQFAQQSVFWPSGNWILKKTLLGIFPEISTERLKQIKNVPEMFKTINMKHCLVMHPIAGGNKFLFSTKMLELDLLTRLRKYRCLFTDVLQKVVYCINAQNEVTFQHRMTDKPKLQCKI